VPAHFEVTPPAGKTHWISRPTESYLHIWQFAATVVLFLLWVKTSAWINQDCQMYNLGYAKWNAVQFFPFVAALLLMLILPFAFGFSIAALVYVTTFFAYTFVRNRSVPNHLKVFTRSWFRFWLADTLGRIGMKVSAEKKAHYEKGAPVELMALGGANEREDQANLIRARQSPGYIMVKELIVDMLAKKSDKTLLDYGREAVAQKYQIDGVWHNGEPRDRQSADLMLAVMKTLAAMDLNDRVRAQQGKFAAKYEKKSYLARLSSQGAQGGERVTLDLDDGKRKFNTIDDLGMREKVRDRWHELVGADQGLLILSTLPGDGLTTLFDTSIEDTDRLMRDWIALEPEAKREREIENVDVEVYDGAAGQSLADILPKVIRKYPNVYIVRDLDSPQAAELLFREIQDDHLVITGVYSKDAPEALLRMLQKKLPQKGLASAVTAVLYMRLIRKLCEECRVPYEPTPDVLQKLGIPQGRVQVLYRAPKPEERDKPCPACHGIGFNGRTGIFELLEVNDEVRQVLSKQPNLDLLKKAARRAGMRSLQEEGILLVAKGVTSLPELMRVLKQ
jgi:type II secretory ATPase GspE/PulE/Tfp pilus assembly ATPase PilB-like protein